MSEKAAEKKSAEAPAKDAHGKDAGDGKKKGGGMLGKTPVILGGVMLIEAVVLIGGFKFIGGTPRSAAAVEIAAEATTKDADGKTVTTDNKAPVELPLIDFRAPNRQNGRTFIYDVAMFVTTSEATQDKVKDLISSRDALIKDRIRTIIAEMDPDKLGGGSEPGLETLRRQVKYQLDQILGDDKLIDEVLVPRCIAFRTDY
jgi:flagellar basal body-associated protein FliL